MKRIALVSSEPLRERMAGIGIRYLELARRLPRDGIEVVLTSPADPGEVPEVPLEPGAVRRFERGRLAEILGDCDGAVAQGQLANDVLVELPELPTAIDLYDPWLVENIHYLETLGLDPYRNDHATWVLQLSRGDFFLCSSDEQRLYYLGFLTALGRVHPELVTADPDVQGLIAKVPFGVPSELPPYRPLLGEPEHGQRRLLFGGLYDWYDPWTLLESLDRLDLGSGLRATVLFVRTPNPDSTPQGLMAEVEEHCRRRGWLGTRVQVLDWVPSDRRYDLLREVDVMVAPHRPTLETRLSLRTRFLDALAARCPVVTTEGGAMSRMLAESGAGWVVPPEDPDALARTLHAVLEGHLGEHQVAARELAERFAWERVLEPLVAFCRDPRRDPTKERYAFRPETRTPPDPTTFRLRRRLSRAPLLRHLFAPVDGGAGGGGGGAGGGEPEGGP